MKKTDEFVIEVKATELDEVGDIIASFILC